MYLYFIRHADPDYENDTITESGKKQAEKLADWLKDLKVDELYNSSMGRAKITASYLEKVWNMKSTSIDWAREIRWGNELGIYNDDKSPWSVKDKLIKNTKSYPKNESWRDLKELENDALIDDYDKHCNNLDDFLKNHGYVRENQLYKAVSPNEKTVVIVCHGGVISALMSHLTNTPLFQYISHMGVDLTAVTKIHLRGAKDESDAAQIIYANSQAHLGII